MGIRKSTLLRVSLGAFLLLISDAAQSRFASELVDYSAINGQKNASTDLTAALVLGPNDCSEAVDFDNFGNTPGFVTVGFGAEILDQPGNDIVFYVTNLNVAGSIVETFSVSVSDDGSSFHVLGSETAATDPFAGEKAFEYDLASVGLTMALFVRVQNLNVNTSTGSEGSDICGFEALNLNQAPQALCTGDQSLETDMGLCEASTSIDGGSFDPDGGTVFLEQVPPPPYGLGSTSVSLLVEDDEGSSSSCSALVTVVDIAVPVALCNAPGEITPPSAPISFVASAEDNCEVEALEVFEFDCFKRTKKGKRVDKRESCQVEIGGSEITILDSGGVGTTITWKVVARDSSGNVVTRNCAVTVSNPGRGRQ